MKKAFVLFFSFWSSAMWMGGCPFYDEMFLMNERGVFGDGGCIAWMWLGGKGGRIL